MKRKQLSMLTGIYTILVLGTLIIWAFTAQDENDLIDPREHTGTLLSFLGLLLIGLILAGINFAGVRDGTATVNKKTVISGLSIGLGFLIWRLLMIIS